MYEEAKSGALYAMEIYEMSGAVGDVERCKQLVQQIEEEM